MAASGAKVLRNSYDVDAIRQNPTLFVARNATLETLADRTGQLNEALGALSLSKRGEPIGYYANQAHIEDVVAVRKTSVESLAAEACDACPVLFTCGIGPDALRDALIDKKVRRRFRTRMRNAATNTHFCATNLKPSRLRKAVA